MIKLKLQMFGGRGASSGMSIAGRKYGTEYKTLHVKDSVKYIRYNFSMASKNPFETQAKDRIYAIVNFQDEVKSIVFFDSNGMESKEIDISGRAHIVNGERVLPHAHLGYNHGEKGTRKLTEEEQDRVDTILKEWYNFKRRK